MIALFGTLEVPLQCAARRPPSAQRFVSTLDKHA